MPTSAAMKPHRFGALTKVSSIGQLPSLFVVVSLLACPRCARIACQSGNSKIVQLLLSVGADKNKLDAQGRSPLWSACGARLETDNVNTSFGDHLEAVRLLLEASAHCDTPDETLGAFGAFGAWPSEAVLAQKDVITPRLYSSS